MESKWPKGCRAPSLRRLNVSVRASRLVVALVGRASFPIQTCNSAWTECSRRRSFDFFSVRLLDHQEIVSAKFAVAGCSDVKQEHLVEDAITLIARLAGKIELGRQHLSARPLDLEVVVPGTTGIKAWHDGVEPPSSLRIGELMSAKFVAAVVINAGLVGMP